MSPERPRFIGILPAAGLGSRLKPFRYPKELLPIVYVPNGNGQHVRPMLAAEYSLQAMRRASITQCFIVISDWKTEIIRYFGDGVDIGVRIAYLHQTVPHGLANAVNTAYDWVGESYVCLALPDTIFSPFDAIAKLRQQILLLESDLVLGVFPTPEPQHFGPTRIKSDCRVIEVLDKPAHTDLANTWGIAIWSPRFTHFLHESVHSFDKNEEQVIGDIFNSAILHGLNVHAVFFQSGMYTDLGRAEGISSIILPKNGSDGYDSVGAAFSQLHLQPLIESNG